MIRELHWVVETVCSEKESLKADDFATMEFLQTVSMNAAEPLDLKVEIIPDNKLKVTEVYRRELFTSKQLPRSDIDQMLVQSLCLLLHTKETKMILPHAIGFDKKKQAWKFIVAGIIDKPIPRAYPVLNWGITMFSACFAKEWASMSKEFEEALKNEEAYNRVLYKYLSLVDNEDVRNTFNGIMRYGSLCKYLRLKDVKLNVGRSMLINNSIARVATKANCFNQMRRSIGKKVPYVVLECNHPMSAKQGAQQLCYWPVSYTHLTLPTKRIV
eukprot:TRINITY_DN26538_c0_g2_i2.p1 TRINITY_DN26538_c0_g2~~TRINITY_DN26538_c0_g2_i2.p1  ORF type:complete len:271 (+),score=42.29 TRINITY_DN26538_c0_g2_i2:115-927(+)